MHGRHMTRFFVIGPWRLALSTLEQGKKYHVALSVHGPSSGGEKRRIASLDSVRFKASASRLRLFFHVGCIEARWRCGIHVTDFGRLDRVRGLY